MNILIIEDEPNAARQLKEMILRHRPGAIIGPIMDSIDAVTLYLNQNSVDLMFLDVHLSDGHAFSIFDKVEFTCPIIFTTAYDQYAVKAFEVNSIDYLLKPMSEERLVKALKKFDRLSHDNKAEAFDSTYMERLHKFLSLKEEYKQSFLIPYKDRLLPVPVRNFAWFEIQQSVITGMMFDGVVHVLEERSLDELNKVLDPRQFYRANRQFLVNKSALKEVVQYFNGKLLLKMAPNPSKKVIVSREKVSHFKRWIMA